MHIENMLSTVLNLKKKIIMPLVSVEKQRAGVTKKIDPAIIHVFQRWMIRGCFVENWNQKSLNLYPGSFFSYWKII